MSIPLTNIWGLRLLSYVFDLLKPQKEDTILDLGCGSGSAVLLLANGVKHVVGIDISQDTVRFLSERQTPKNVEFRALDATREPPADLSSKFDKCICLDMLEHIENRSSVLAFIRNTLKPGGEFVISFPVEKTEHGCNPVTRAEVYGLAQQLTANSRIMFISKSWLARLIDRIYKLVRVVLRYGEKESDVFEDSVCYQILAKPGKIHWLYGLGIALLFRLTQNAYRENSMGRRAIIHGHTPV